MTCVSKWSRTTHRFGDSLGGPARLGMQSTHCSDLSLQKEEAHGPEPEEARPKLPVESRRTPVIPPALSYDDTCEVSCAREAHQRLGAQFSWRPVTCASPAQHVPGSRSPEGKQIFIGNHIVFTGSLGAGRLSYQGMVGTLQKSTLPEAPQRPVLQFGLSKEKVSVWLLTLLCTHVL